MGLLFGKRRGWSRSSRGTCPHNGPQRKHQPIVIYGPLPGNGLNRWTHYHIVGPVPGNEPKRTDPKENAPAAKQRADWHTCIHTYIHTYIQINFRTMNGWANSLCIWNLAYNMEVPDQCHIIGIRHISSLRTDTTPHLITHSHATTDILY
jgi:hypothetical protein